VSTSTAYQVLNEWYNTYLSSYDNYIDESSFCSEQDFDLEEDTVKYFNAYIRIVNDNTYNSQCSASEESLKIGLLSIDEVIYAGAGVSGSNTSYYLYNPNITENWWTLSGSQVLLNYNVVDNFSIDLNGNIIKDSKLTGSNALRPVITLNKSVTAQGSGSKTNPYVIE
jgi:hypothetical protein